MALDFSETQWAIVDCMAGEAERVHFGRVRLVEKFVVLHEEEQEPGCCDQAITLVSLESVIAISIYTDKTKLDEAVKKAGIQKIASDAPNGPEVR